MEFNILIKKGLFPILQKFGFQIIEEYKNVLRVQSSVIELILVYNEFEKSCYISIGKKGGPLFELRNNAMKVVLNSSLSIEHVTPDIFVQNLSSLFQSIEGTALLKGDIESFIEFKTSEDNYYTSELLLKQALERSAKAWEAKDYPAFVESIDKIGISRIPQSFQLKYKIAKQKS